MTALDYFTRTSTIHIATELKAGGEVVTPIWAVVVDGVPYMRSGYGATSKWYRRVRRTHHATFVDGRHRYPATVEPVTDEATKAKVDAAYRAKYGSGPSVDDVVAPNVRDFTLRIDLEEQR